MPIENDLKILVGEIKGQLKAFIELYTADIQRVYEVQKINTDFLRNEVRSALNSHAKIKGDIEELKAVHSFCPIVDITKRVENIEKITAKDKFFEDNPDIKKGNNVWQLLKTIGIIIAAIAILISLYLNIIDAINAKIKVNKQIELPGK